jgi:glucosyl-dolichyl phosphate glucuronosyltransferase
MNVSVILCTYNRCQSLNKALGSVAVSSLPHPVEWEVLVVDNNSKDQTREVVEDFSHRYPGRFRYLFEGQQGKSYALNSGIRSAQGEVVAFMDDDAIVEPTWLRNLTASLFDGEWAGAGGRILPEWSSAPPSWLPQKEWLGMAPLTVFDLGVEAGALFDAPFGANMAFHRRVFDKYGGFRIDLGPGLNGKVRNNEDTEFGRRLLAAGERLKYEATAVVHHPASQDRLQKGYFLTWWFNKGRADVRESGVGTDTKWLASGVPLHLFRRIAVGTLRWMVTIEPSQRFTHRLTVWLLAGTMVESYHQSRENTYRRQKLQVSERKP